MRYALRALARNLAAGFALAFFLPADARRFRIDPLQLVLAIVVSAVVDVGADWLRYGPDATLSWAAAGSELAAAGVLIVGSAIVAGWSRQSALLLALPIIVLFSFVPIQIVNLAIDVAPSMRDATVRGFAGIGIMIWILSLLVRAAWVAHAPVAARGARAIASGLVLALPLFLPPGVLPSDAWWIAGDSAGGMVSGASSEAVLALQRRLQDDALAELGDHSPGTTDVYFVGFAPDGAGATWRERIDAASAIMQGHWAAEGRTIGYVNDVRDVTAGPIATVTHLREALDEIASVADPEEDVLVIYVAGRSNADGSITVSLPPLDLVQLSGPGLRSLLDEAGFAWRVIIVASCEPGPFIEALADDETIVLASAAPGASAAECKRGGEPVRLGDALFKDALPRATSLVGAFEAARAQVIAEGGTAPHLHVGAAIAAKLEAVRGKSSGGVRARLDGAHPRRAG